MTIFIDVHNRIMNCIYICIKVLVLRSERVLFYFLVFFFFFSINFSVSELTLKAIFIVLEDPAGWDDRMMPVRSSGYAFIPLSISHRHIPTRALDRDLDSRPDSGVKEILRRSRAQGYSYVGGSQPRRGALWNAVRIPFREYACRNTRSPAVSGRKHHAPDFWRVQRGGLSVHGWSTAPGT